MNACTASLLVPSTVDFRPVTITDEDQLQRLFVELQSTLRSGLQLTVTVLARTVQAGRPQLRCKDCKAVGHASLRYGGCAMHRGNDHRQERPPPLLPPRSGHHEKSEDHRPLTPPPSMMTRQLETPGLSSKPSEPPSEDSGKLIYPKGMEEYPVRVLSKANLAEQKRRYDWVYRKDEWLNNDDLEDILEEKEHITALWTLVNNPGGETEDREFYHWLKEAYYTTVDEEHQFIHSEVSLRSFKEKLPEIKEAHGLKKKKRKKKKKSGGGEDFTDKSNLKPSANGN